MVSNPILLISPILALYSLVCEAGLSGVGRYLEPVPLVKKATKKLILSEANTKSCKSIHKRIRYL